MTLDEAIDMVRPFIVLYKQYKVVSHVDAGMLLGPEKLARLLADPIRKVGPRSDYFYYWNVADYLRMP